MIGKKLNKVFFLILAISLLHILTITTARSTPSFARQTGLSCNECHTVFPELTPFGRIFKLGGYVLSKSTKSFEFPPPLAGMVQASFTDAKGLTSGVAPFDNVNRETDRYNLPQQLSLFYGGRIFKKVGAFIQVTYDGVSNKIFLDMTDIRYSNNAIVLGKNLLYGLSINNSPTVQDGWNSTPAWGFPFASSSVAPTPAAAAIIDGTLDQQVGGIGAYLLWNNLIYLGGTVYRTTANGITKPLGAGTATEQVVDGAAPYWRLALEHRWKNHFFAIGTYGMQAEIFPSGNKSGSSDRYTDIAFDAQYQFLGTIIAEHKQEAGKKETKPGKQIITVHATWIHENQDWKASFPLGNTEKPSGFLNTFRTNLNYYYMAHFGNIAGSVGYFSTTGETDPLLYSPIVVDGSRTGSPNSNGIILETDYVPWKKIKISLQYIIYNKFNGSHSNYDGSGRNASDNNTFYALVWLMI